MEQRYGLAGVMGWPVAHSRSPVLHTYWIEHYGLRGAYVLLPVQPQQLPAAIAGLKVLGFAGCNLTIPHKVASLQLVDAVDPVARRIGAINTIVVGADGSTRGVNTDGFGFLHSLLEEHPRWRADAGPAAVLGAGGAARAVIVSLQEQGAPEIRILNRTLATARSLADEFGQPVRAVPWEQRSAALDGCALLVNTTNQGMSGQPALDLNLDTLPGHALVADVVYIPLETPLLVAARGRGNPTVNGLGMLLHQARPAFEAWFGVLPDVTPQLRQRVLASFR